MGTGLPLAGAKGMISPPGPRGRVVGGGGKGGEVLHSVGLRESRLVRAVSRRSWIVRGRCLRPALGIPEPLSGFFFFFLFSVCISRTDY